MSTDKFGASPAVPTETPTDLRVECYVRSTVPGPTTETITAIVNRLRHLRDCGQIRTYHVTPWPPERHTVSQTDTAHEPTRDGLVAEFEHWAEKHDVTLEPAFRRREVPSSPLGIGSDEPREQVRVPIVALALYADEESAEAPTATEPLRGVVPYTEQPYPDTTRTYTVDDWLSTVESEEIRSNFRDAQTTHQSLLEGKR